MESENALQESIKRKGETSYYYAHARRNTEEEGKKIEGDRIVTGGPPRLVASGDRVEMAPQGKVLPITNYSWLDEDESVKIYIPFSVKPEDVEVHFDSRSFELEYRLDSDLYKLIVKKLRKEISPSESKYRVGNSKIIITLKKAAIDKWYVLADN